MSSTIRSITNNTANMYNVMNRASSAASKVGNNSQDYRQNLLNAFNNSQNSGGGNMFGMSGVSGNSGMNDMFKLAADYTSYNKGGFNVAMNALRSGFSGRAAQINQGVSSVSNTSAASGNSAERAQNVKLADASQSLSDASVALTTTGANSLFKAAEDGSYDRDAIQSAVSDFVNAYNDTRSAVLGSNNAKAISTEVSVVTQTSNMQDQLGKIGITVNSDNTLSVDKEKLASADIGDIKSVFNGTGSYAYSVGSSADNITSNAVDAAGSSYRSQNAALSSMRTSAARTAAKAEQAKGSDAQNAAAETAATQAAAEDITAAQTETAGAVQAAGQTPETAAAQAAANQAELAAQAANASPYYDGEESTGTIVDLIA